MRTRFLMLLGVALAALFFQVGAASAQATRTWVSGVGDDVNPCSRTAPCKTFAGAISKTATGGEINTLDPGGFGGVTITKAISIINEGHTGGVLVGGGAAGIIVNAPAGANVLLQGLDIEGIGTGADGVRVLSASRVTIRNCAIRNFTDAGVDVNGPVGTRVTVEDSRITTSLVGVRVLGAGGAGNSVTILNSTIERNSAGVEVTGASAVFIRGSNILSSAGDDLKLLSGGKATSTGDNFIVSGSLPTTTLSLK